MCHVITLYQTASTNAIAKWSDSDFRSAISWAALCEKTTGRLMENTKSGHEFLDTFCASMKNRVLHMHPLLITPQFLHNALCHLCEKILCNRFLLPDQQSIVMSVWNSYERDRRRSSLDPEGYLMQVREIHQETRRAWNTICEFTSSTDQPNECGARVEIQLLHQHLTRLTEAAISSLEPSEVQVTNFLQSAYDQEPAYIVHLCAHYVVQRVDHPTQSHEEKSIWVTVVVWFFLHFSESQFRDHFTQLPDNLLCLWCQSVVKLESSSILGVSQAQWASFWNVMKEKQPTLYHLMKHSHQLDG